MYHIGQFRRPQLDSYSTPLSMELGRQQTESVFSGDILFYNTCGNLSGDNVMNSQNCYYLRFGVKQRKDSEQVFYLKIRNVSETEDNEQLIDEFKVARGTGTVYFEVILSPNATYNQVLWELQRTTLDYNMLNADDTAGRVINIVDYTYTKLIDVLTTLKSTYTGMEYLTKIGIQGPPSLLMCINREQIRIGKTGIYEINNGINITSISFVPKTSTLSSDGLDYFIMDFEY